MKYFLSTILISLCAFALQAQENDLLTLRIEARLDYMQEYISGNKINDNSGFKGKYLNIRMDGNITDSFSYSYRQRLNKPNKDATFFDATDWITLTYSFDNWSFSAGKQVVGIGGYEYDKAPIDLYFCSEYWNNIACYQLGASVTYALPGGNDRFMFQFCESPFRKNILNIENREMFAYNLMWTGTHDWFSSIYSVNMLEYMPGRFINYIALGNRFTFNRFTIDLDIMNRAGSFKTLLGKDMSFMCDIAWQPIERLRIFAHLTHDFNNSGEIADLCVVPGVNITRMGGGIEFFPLKDHKNLRLHLNGCYTFGKTVETAVLRPHQTLIDCGITWYMNMLRLKNR